MLTDDLIRQFEAKVSPDWMWTGAKNQTGHGLVYNPQTMTNTYAHQVSWMIYNRVRELPKGDGYQIDCSHLCNVPSCVRGSHLIAEPHAANIRRSYTNDYPMAGEHG